jgi:putative acetyltransferase
MTDVTVAEERPDQSEVGELIAQSDAFLSALYPPEHQRRQPTVAALLGEDVHFIVARRDGNALGCMALLRTGPDKGELRRCFVTEAARGQGAGLAMLLAAEAAARAQQMRVIQLETGNHNIAALRLYRGNGYRERGPFGDYPDDGVSVFMEKKL